VAWNVRNVAGLRAFRPYYVPSPTQPITYIRHSSRRIRRARALAYTRPERAYKHGLFISVLGSTFT